MQFKDYYKIPGVNPDASSKEITIAYRKLARKYHHKALKKRLSWFD